LNMSIYFAMSAWMAMTFIRKHFRTLSCSIFEKKVRIYLLHILFYMSTFNLWSTRESS
jgi:hypothetical protein